MDSDHIKLLGSGIAFGELNRMDGGRKDDMEKKKKNEEGDDGFGGVVVVLRTKKSKNLAVLRRRALIEIQGIPNFVVRFVRFVQYSCNESAPTSTE